MLNEGEGVFWTFQFWTFQYIASVSLDNLNVLIFSRLFNTDFLEFSFVCDLVMGSPKRQGREKTEVFELCCIQQQSKKKIKEETTNYHMQQASSGITTVETSRSSI